MRSSQADILFVPGAGALDADHWLTRWESRLATGRFAAHPRDCSDLGALTQSVADALSCATRPVVLIGHSFGALGIAHAAASMPEGLVRGAFLVSPPSMRAVEFHAGIDPAFAPPPTGPLPFPSLLIASRDDPFAAYEEMETMALDWGAQIIDAGAAGHIDAASGHGPWPEGLMRFAAFLARL